MYAQISIVKQVNKERSQASVLGSKAVGEPPFLYGLAGWFSIMNALSFITRFTRKD